MYSDLQSWNVPFMSNARSCNDTWGLPTTHFSRVFIDKLDQGLHSCFLLQQLQTWSVRVWDITQSVLPMKISSMEFSSQQGPRTATVHWDLCCRTREKKVIITSNTNPPMFFSSSCSHPACRRLSGHAACSCRHCPVVCSRGNKWSRGFPCRGPRGPAWWPERRPPLCRHQWSASSSSYLWETEEGWGGCVFRKMTVFFCIPKWQHESLSSLSGFKPADLWMLSSSTCRNSCSCTDKVTRVLHIIGLIRSWSIKFFIVSNQSFINLCVESLNREFKLPVKKVSALSFILF